MKNALKDFSIGLIGGGIGALIVTSLILSYQGNALILNIVAVMVGASLTIAGAVYVSETRWRKEKEELASSNMRILIAELQTVKGAFSAFDEKISSDTDTEGTISVLSILLDIEYPKPTALSDGHFMRGLDNDVILKLQVISANYVRLESQIRVFERCKDIKEAQKKVRPKFIQETTSDIVANADQIIDTENTS